MKDIVMYVLFFLRKRREILDFIKSIKGDPAKEGNDAKTLKRYKMVMTAFRCLEMLTYMAFIGHFVYIMISLCAASNNLWYSDKLGYIFALMARGAIGAFPVLVQIFLVYCLFSTIYMGAEYMRGNAIAYEKPIISEKERAGLKKDCVVCLISMCFALGSYLMLVGINKGMLEQMSGAKNPLMAMLFLGFLIAGIFTIDMMHCLATGKKNG